MYIYIYMHLFLTLNCNVRILKTSQPKFFHIIPHYVHSYLYADAPGLLFQVEIFLCFDLFRSLSLLSDINVCRWQCVSSALPSHSRRRHPHQQQQRIVPVLLFSCSSPGLAPVFLIMSDSFRLTDFTSALLPSHHDHHHLSFR